MANKEQRSLVFGKIGYAPTKAQQLVHDCPSRIRLVAGGERSGKSFLGANDLTARLPEGTLYWLVAADYERTRPEFNYCLENAEKLGFKIEATKNVDPGRIDLPEIGVKIYTKSAKDPRKLASEAPDGIIGCEASQLTYEDFLRLRGRLTEKRGWMLLEGTFESSLGWYPEMYNRGLSPNPDDIASFSLPTWSNTKLFPGGRNDPEIIAVERIMPADMFLERLGGVPCPPKGLVFTEFQTSVHTGTGGIFDIDYTQPVEIWVDPGYQHNYAVEVVQQKGEQLVIVDEIYETGLMTPDIITLCQQKPWWLCVKSGVIDIHAKAKSGLIPDTQIWLNQGQIFLQSQYVKVEDGIARMKTSLKVNPITGHPQLYINSKCKGIISELGGCPDPKDGQTKVYKWKVDRDGNIIGTVPEDKNNDACKAVAYGLVNKLGYVPSAKGIKVVFH